MKFAILSDIHGNLPALNAALADAEKNEVDKILLLGDYCITLPWVNEVIETIRGLKSAVVIRGNNEGYLINLLGQNNTDWSRKQFGPIYWSFSNLKPENLEYITSLPETAVIQNNSGDIHLEHSMKLFFRVPKVRPFRSSQFRKMMEENPFTHDEYLALAKNEILSRPDALEEFRALPEGVYLFGHNHLQFHMFYEDKLFVNPGSCGIGCDYAAAASYTIIEHAGNR